MYHRFNLGFEGQQGFARTFNEREVSSYLSKAQLELIKQRFAAFRNSKQIGMGNTLVPQAKVVRSSELAGLLSGTAEISNTEMIVGTVDNGALYTPEIRDGEGSSNEFGVFVPLPNEAMYVLHEVVNTTGNLATSTPLKRNVPTREISLEEYSQGFDDYYKRPYYNLVWSIDMGNYDVSVASTSDSVIGFADSTTGKSGNDASNGAAATSISSDIRRIKHLIPGKDWYIHSYRCSYLKRPSDIVVDLVTPSNQTNCELADFLHQEIVDYAVKLASASIIPEQGKYQVNQIESKEDE
jgi:hypothetical protein